MAFVKKYVFFRPGFFNINTKAMENIFISNQSNLADAAKELLAQQKTEWELLANGSKSLETVEVKEFQFDGFSLKVQFNPGRIISTSAKVDPKSIKERKCFLCPQNLPPEQKGILYKDHYIVLCNPFPIFPEHFTIPGKEHKPQAIQGAFASMLEFSRDISKYYTVFYNGPKCGASAPDHFHFQAGDKNFMTIDHDYPQLKQKYSDTIYSNDNLKVIAIDDTLRKMIAFESAEIDVLADALEKFYVKYKALANTEEEPMMNVLSLYENGAWRVIILLRQKHRPSHYFNEGDGQIMLSPASVDLGGVCITPLEKDFNKITKDILSEIFKEVFVTESRFEEIKKAIKGIF